MLRFLPLFFTLLATGSFGCGGDGGTANGGPDSGPGGDPPTQLQRLIRSDTDPRLVLEVDYVEGMEPYADTGPGITAGLADIVDKPDGIEVVLDGTIPSNAGGAWTTDDIMALGDDTFDLQVPDGTVKIHVMFVDGHDASDDDSSQILGRAWQHRHIIIYKQTIEDNCSGLIGGLQQQLCENAEMSILTHEVGHVLGLVNNGLEMVTDHEDPDHPRHDVDDQCVMFWAYEGDQAIDQLTTRLMNGNMEALGFDQACLDDIAALRNAP